MKILISSHFFHPSVGGLEEVSRILADEFTTAGHSVQVITRTPGGNEAGGFPYAVHRQPGIRKLLELHRWCDVCLHNQISLQTAWPLLFFHRPWFITHATWTRRVSGELGWQDKLKLFVYRFAHNLAISQSIADALLPLPSTLVGNPYRAALFQSRPGQRRERELIFLGRLVSDKGVDTLLHAMTRLRSLGMTPKLTIVGRGAEEASLRSLSRTLGLEGQVAFAGSMTGERLVETLNSHQILVVPSLWEEPFGVVALEGIACGCVVVGSARGGLRDAIGPCGVTFANGDPQALAEALAGLLERPERLGPFREAGPKHLERFQPGRVAGHYLELFQRALLAGRREQATGRTDPP